MTMIDWFTPTVTRAVLLVWVALLVVYAVLAIRFGGREASVSAAVSQFCFDNPIVAFAMGLLVGHFIWPVR